MPFKDLPQGLMKSHLDEIIIATAERIVIDYANLSGRESAHRAEFRNRVVEHLRTSLISLLEKYGEEIIKTPIDIGAFTDKQSDMNKLEYIAVGVTMTNYQQRTKLKEIINSIQI